MFIRSTERISRTKYSPLVKELLESLCSLRTAQPDVFFKKKSPDPLNQWALAAAGSRTRPIEQGGVLKASAFKWKTKKQRLKGVQQKIQTDRKRFYCCF